MTQTLPSKNLVLYADDDPDDINLLQSAFEKFENSLELRTFANGDELLQYLTSNEDNPAPCLIILDINMPVKGGKKTLAELRSMSGFEDIPVVLFSTSTLPSEKAFARSLGAGMVAKPLYMEQLQHLVDKILDHCSDEIKKMVKGSKR